MSFKNPKTKTDLWRIPKAPLPKAHPREYLRFQNSNFQREIEVKKILAGFLNSTFVSTGKAHPAEVNDNHL